MTQFSRHVFPAMLELTVICSLNSLLKSMFLTSGVVVSRCPCVQVNAELERQAKEEYAEQVGAEGMAGDCETYKTLSSKRLETSWICT